MANQFCHNCSNPISIQIFKGEDWCSDDCRKALAALKALDVPPLNINFHDDLHGLAGKIIEHSTKAIEIIETQIPRENLGGLFTIPVPPHVSSEHEAINKALKDLDEKPIDYNEVAYFPSPSYGVDITCSYEKQWTDEVGEIDVCLMHGMNSRWDESNGAHRPCLAVDPWPVDLS